MGYTAEELYSDPFLWNRSIHPDDQAYVARAVAEFGQGKNFDLEYRIRDLEGNWHWFRDHSTSRRETTDEVIIDGLAIDITERKRVEQELLRSEERFSSAFENAVIGMSLVSPDGRLLKVNLALCKILGYQEEELLSKTFQEITHPDDLEADLTFVRQALAGDITTCEMEKRYIHKMGFVVWAQLNASLIRDENDKPELFVAQIQDITERKRAAVVKEVNLKIADFAITTDEIKAFYSQIHNILRELMPVDNFYIALYHPDTDFISFPYFADQFDPPPAPHKLRPGLIAYLLHTGKPLHINREEYNSFVEQGNIEPMGTDPFNWLGSPLLIEGKLIGAMVTQSFTEDVQFSEDDLSLFNTISKQIATIIQRKQAEEVLRQAEEKYRNIFDNALEGIFQSLPEGRFITVNAAFARMLGYETPDELMEAISDISSQVYVESSRRADFMQALIEHEIVTDFEFEMKRKDGKTIWVTENARTVCDDTGKILYYEGVAKDITEQKKAEQTIQHRLEYEKLIGQISNVFINLSSGQVDLEINRTLHAIGEFAGVDRSYVFLFSEDAMSTSNTHEWCAEGIEPQIDNLQEIPVETIPWWIAQLKQMNTINIARLADLPPEASAEKEILQSQAIQSLLVTPMAFSSFGFLGFDSVRAERIWDEETANLLRVVGEIIGGAIIRERALDNLGKSQVELKRTIEQLEMHLSGAINVMAMVVEKRDPYTAGHQGRVASLSTAIAEELGL